MKSKSRLVASLALSIAMLALPIFATDLATWSVAGDSIFVTPRANAAGGMMLNVGAPNGDVFSQKFADGEPLSFRAIDGAGNSLDDGLYTIELIALPGARDRKDSSAHELDRRVQTFSATMVGGAFVLPDAEETFTKDQQILDDLIVGGSFCVGLDCNNGESFGFDTIRIKENNVRLHFDDTSNSASFPQNDWRFVANDSGNGGLNYLGIEDSTAGRIPFRVEAGAPVNALYVEADGDVGIKTANPVVDLHIVEGNTPSLRLEQDGSDGFTPQTWDVAGNESNFFIRDVTNGSKLSFRIRPSAPESSIDIQGSGDIGMGTSSPDGPLHVRRTTATAVDLLTLENGGPARFVLENTASDSWQFNSAGDGLRISDVEAMASTEFLLQTNGDLTITGNYFSTACPSPTPCAPDYVFAPDYDLLSLDQVADFIEENQHLPNVPSADELTGPINMTQMQMTLLEKVEELTLYTLQQQKTIEALKADLDALKESKTEEQ